MDKRTQPLRLMTGSIVMLTLLASGLFSRSPWLIVVAAPFLTLLYALGKWPLWLLAWTTGGWRSIAVSAATTLPIQAVFAGVFYLIGLGLSRLVFGSQEITSLAVMDIAVGGTAVAVCLLASGEIIRREGAPQSAPEAAQPDATQTAESHAYDDELAPGIDPNPLTEATFFRSPGYWTSDALDEAMEGRGRPFDKHARGASAEEITQVEARLGVRLPDGLRRLYGIMDGGYVGEMYVPASSLPLPHNDWRGAFSIDYSSLVPLKALRTVEEHYNDWTDDSEDIPKGAEKLIVLQARYGDMTLLDYNDGPEARVLLVDFEKNGDMKDVAFDNFDRFFEQLRRPIPEPNPSFARLDFRTVPLSSLPLEARPAAFWSGDAHRYANIAAGTEGAVKPKPKADDDLLAETEARIGLTLPDTLKAYLRERNGGAVAYGFLDWPYANGEAEGHGTDGEVHLFEALAPAEYIATLGQLSDRVRFTDGETPWRDSVDDTDRLVVLQATQKASILLDYRAPGEPIVTRALHLSERGLDDARSYDTFGGLVGKLRALKPRA